MIAAIAIREDERDVSAVLFGAARGEVVGDRHDELDIDSANIERGVAHRRYPNMSLTRSNRLRSS